MVCPNLYRGDIVIGSHTYALQILRLGCFDCCGAVPCFRTGEYVGSKAILTVFFEAWLGICVHPIAHGDVGTCFRSPGSVLALEKIWVPTFWGCRG